MSKPRNHSLSSAKKFGGEWTDYIEIHSWFDQTKGYVPDHRHRAILHSAFGVFLASQVFGEVINGIKTEVFRRKSDGKEVSVRDIGEQHVIEDLGWIPTMQDYLQHMEVQEWMGDRKSTRLNSSHV